MSALAEVGVFGSRYRKAFLVLLTIYCSDTDELSSDIPLGIEAGVDGSEHELQLNVAAGVC